MPMTMIAVSMKDLFALIATSLPDNAKKRLSWRRRRLFDSNQTVRFRTYAGSGNTWKRVRQVWWRVDHYNNRPVMVRRYVLVGRLAADRPQMLLARKKTAALSAFSAFSASSKQPLSRAPSPRWSSTDQAAARSDCHVGWSQALGCKVGLCSPILAARGVLPVQRLNACVNALTSW